MYKYIIVGTGRDYVKLEKAQEEYEELVREKEEKEKEALYKAYKKGKRTLQEVLDFIKGKADL